MRTYLLCLSSLVLASCGGAGTGATDVLRSVSAGIEIVAYHIEDRELTWRFRAVFSIGAAESGPDGRITVLGADDLGVQRITVLRRDP